VIDAPGKLRMVQACEGVRELKTLAGTAKKEIFFAVEPYGISLDNSTNRNQEET